MKKIVALTAATALAGIATPAIAQIAPAPSGPRVEAVVGYDALRVDLDDFGIDEDLKDNDILYGIGAGYDFAVSPSMSAGIDAEVTWSNNKENFNDLDENVEISTGRDLYLGGRATFPISNSANAYVKAGYTNLRVEGDVGSLEESFDLDGYRLGAGAQFGIGGGAYVGGEYRFSDYEDDVTRHQVALTLGTRF